MNATLVQSCTPCDFGPLPSFSRRQASAWNALRRAVGDGAGWKSWIEEGLGDFFESADGFEIRVRQKHTMDPQQPETTFTFDAAEITLGRDDDCDVRLAPRSIGKRHARIFTRDGACYIEDLGSGLGTFLNESRLAPSRPTPVATGDQFAIFPYTFTLELTERWVRNTHVDVCGGPVSPLNYRAFLMSAPKDHVPLAVQLHPIGAAFLLEAGRTFLENLSARLLAPLCLGAADRLGLTPADTGFFELLIAAVLERINRDLQFPLQAALAPTGSLPALRGDAAGVSFSFAIRVAELTGTFRLFMTDDAVELLARSSPSQASAALPEVSWSFPVSAGYAELTTAEATQIEPSDIVLLEREAAILFPNSPDRGWKLLPEPGNFSRAIIENYFERRCLIDSETEREAVIDEGAAPDLASLPIRIHAIVGEKEMTLAEANLLVAGAIVELDRTKTDPVRIALNGKIAGAGELVEVDGRLGVRILNWRVP